MNPGRALIAIKVHFDRSSAGGGFWNLYHGSGPTRLPKSRSSEFAQLNAIANFEICLKNHRTALCAYYPSAFVDTDARAASTRSVGLALRLGAKPEIQRMDAWQIALPSPCFTARQFAGGDEEGAHLPLAVSRVISSRSALTRGVL
jgi:hypothetical protein